MDQPRSAAMGLVVFAHTPPPHHGQSRMVELMLEELRGGEPGLDRVFHVNCRLSDDLNDVGRAGPRKVLRLLGYCWQAITLRLRHGACVLYYVPAPAKRAAVVRDWLAMLLLRPFFPRLVLHWHAVGLGAWAGGGRGWERALTRRALGGAALSLVLSELSRPDAEVFHPRRVLVLPNGIPDPCPDFESAVLPARVVRAGARRTATAGNPAVFRVLFLAHGTPEKGLDDALTAVAAAERELRAGGAAITLRLTVAGTFPDPGFERDFRARNAALAGEFGHALAEIVGFAAGAEKARLFRESDVFLFPTYYPTEGMPVTLLEALAHGLPIIASRWRAIPEMLPATGGGAAPGHGVWLVTPRQPAEAAAALAQAAGGSDPGTAGATTRGLRAHFLAHYQSAAFGRQVRAALREVMAAA